MYFTPQYLGVKYILIYSGYPDIRGSTNYRTDVRRRTEAYGAVWRPMEAYEGVWKRRDGIKKAYGGGRRPTHRHRPPLLSSLIMKDKTKRSKRSCFMFTTN